MEQLETRITPSVYTWMGGNGNWQDLNWRVNGNQSIDFPTTGDTAVITGNNIIHIPNAESDNCLTVNVDVGSTLGINGNLVVFNGGTINGSLDVVTGAYLDLQGGSLSLRQNTAITGSGNIYVDNGGVLSLSTTVPSINPTLNIGVSYSNVGSVGTLDVSGLNATTTRLTALNINSQGLLQFSDVGTATAGLSGDLTITNYGTITRLSTGTGNQLCEFAINNIGTINIQLNSGLDLDNEVDPNIFVNQEAGIINIDNGASLVSGCMVVNYGIINIGNSNNANNPISYVSGGLDVKEGSLVVPGQLSVIGGSFTLEGTGTVYLQVTVDSGNITGYSHINADNIYVDNNSTDTAHINVTTNGGAPQFGQLVKLFQGNIHKDNLVTNDFVFVNFMNWQRSDGTGYIGLTTPVQPQGGNE